jgi:Zn-dependent alcohol dehydrogenase
MPERARIAVLPPKAGSRLEIVEVDLPSPSPNQVVVREFASGICHSQLHTMHRVGRTAPQLLGHEAIGVVVATGTNVDSVSEGDEVMVTWVPRTGTSLTRPLEPSRVPLPDGNVASSRDVFTWGDHTVVDEQFVVRVPTGTRPDVTAVIGCAIITGAGAVMNSAHVQRGDSVAIFGVGGVGLAAVTAAREVGADPIIAVDLADDKLTLAYKFGATHIVNASNTDPVTRIRELTVSHGEHDFLGQSVAGVDYAFDCIGEPITMRQIVAAARAGEFGVRQGGTAVLVGVPQQAFELDALGMLLGEKSFLASLGGSCVPDRDFPVFLDWYAMGRLDLDTLVSARYPLDQINEATTALDHGEIAGRAILVF